MRIAARAGDPFQSSTQARARVTGGGVANLSASNECRSTITGGGVTAWGALASATVTGSGRFFFIPKAIASITGGATAAFVPAAIAFANGYTNRRLLGASARGTTATALSGYLLYIKETQTWLKSASNNGKVQSTSGFDIRFETTAGVKMAHDLVSYDPVAGTIEAYLLIPSWTINTQFKCTMYYGKAGLLATEADASATYANYVAIWDARTGVDRSGNGRNFTMTSVAAGTLIGDAGSYNGTTSLGVITDPAWWGGWPAATIQLWCNPSFTPGAGQNRGQFLQGTIGSPANVAGMAVYWRETAANVAVTKPWFSTFNCSTTENQGYTISDKDRQLTVNQLFHATWQSGQAPKNYLQGVRLPDSTASISTGTIAKLGSGNLYLGETTTDDAGNHPRTGPWKGLLDEVRLRAIVLPPEHIAAEYDNWVVPQLFYGIGGEDLATDSNAAPLALPNFDVPTNQNIAVSIDLVADDYDPEGGTKTLAAVGTPTPSGTASIPIGLNTALFTPSGGFTGRATFSYTLQEPGGKQAIGWCSVQVNPVTVPVSGDGIPVAAQTINVATATTDAGRMQNLVTAINGANLANGPTWIVLPDGVYDTSGATATGTKANVSNGDLTISAAATTTKPLVIVAQTMHGATLRASGNTIALSGANIIMYKLRSEHRTGSIAGTRNRWCRCRTRLVNPNYVGVNFLPSDTAAQKKAKANVASAAMDSTLFVFAVGGTRGRVDHCEVTVDDWPPGDMSIFPSTGANAPRRNAFHLANKGLGPGVPNIPPADLLVLDQTLVHTFFSIDSNWIHLTPPKPNGTLWNTRIKEYSSGYSHTLAIGTNAEIAGHRCAGLIYHNIIDQILGSDGILEPKISDLTVWGNTCKNWIGDPRRPGFGQINNRQGWNNAWIANHCRNIGQVNIWSGPHLVIGNNTDDFFDCLSGYVPAGTWDGSGDAGTKYETSTSQWWFGHVGKIRLGKKEDGNEALPPLTNRFGCPASGVTVPNGALAAPTTVYDAATPAEGVYPDGIPAYTAAAAMTSPVLNVVDVAQSGTIVTTNGDAGPWATYTALPAWGPGFTTRKLSGDP